MDILKRLNPTWSKVFGWTGGRIVFKAFLEFICEEDKQKTIDVTSSLVDGNQVFGFENRCLCKDGTYKWLVLESLWI